jgi:hypothetical protein
LLHDQLWLAQLDTHSSLSYARRPLISNWIVMSSEISSNVESADAESRMRRNLGLDATTDPASASLSLADPLKGARQAIRSQAAAREYVERQLAYAETTISDLQSKLHQARREKDAAIESGRAAMAAKIVAERNLMAAEAALSTEKTTRECRDRALRDAQAMVKELEGRRETARQALQTTQAELAAERQARLKKETAKAVTATPEPVPPTGPGDGAVPPVPSRRGRPPKITVVQPVAVPSEASTPVIIHSFPTQPTTRKPATGGRSPAPKPVKWWVKGR